MNFNRLLGKELIERGFLLSKGQLYKIAQDSLTSVDADTFYSAKLPILIVGRDHYQEIEKKYPIVDRADVKKIINLDFAEGCLVDAPKIGEQETVVRAWVIDNKVRSIVNDKLLFWIPETWLFKFSQENALYRIEREQILIWVCQSKGQIYSSVARGILAQQSNFLLSIGVESDINTKIITVQEYGKLLVECTEQVDILSGVKLSLAQGYMHKIKGAWNWLSVMAGTAAGVLLFLSLHIAYLNLSINRLDEKIDQQNVAEVIALQKQYEDKKSIVDSLQNALLGDKSNLASWGILATLMENDVTILRVTQNKEVLEVRAQSELATNTLQLLTNLPNVVKAEFITPVRESLGNERYTMAITLASKVSSSE